MSTVQSPPDAETPAPDAPVVDAPAPAAPVAEGPVTDAPPAEHDPPLWRRVLLRERGAARRARRERNGDDRPRLPLWKRVLLWRASSGAPRWRRYALLGVLINFAIWGLTISFLTLVPPRYTSKWTLILPGSGSSAVVSLNAVGQVRTSSPSAYSHASLSPKVTYSNIATSSTVLAAAAAMLELAPRAFGKPKVKLIQQTPLMEFTVSALSPEQARRRSWALYNALQDTLHGLRLDEVRQRERGYRALVEKIAEKMTAAQQKLLAFQTETGLVSVDQYLQLAVSVDEMRRQLADLRADYSGQHSLVDELTATLGIGPMLAADALTLAADELFGELRREYAEASSLLASYEQKWGANHARVKAERARRNGTLAALRQRLRTLTGRDDDTLLGLDLSRGPDRSKLFAGLIDAYGEQQATASRLGELERSIASFLQRLRQRGLQAARLAELQREHELAEAVFTAAQARIDNSQADLYASYPMLQMLAEPSLPDAPSSPKTKLVLAGAAGASLFGIIGLILLWLREPYLQKILKSA